MFGFGKKEPPAEAVKDETVPRIQNALNQLIDEDAQSRARTLQYSINNWMRLSGIPGHINLEVKMDVNWSLEKE